MDQKDNINRQFILKQRPVGEPKLSDFEFIKTEIPKLKSGELLVRNVYLSLDPFIRGRMSDAESYAPPMNLNDVMIGIGVGRVIQSTHSDYKEGDWICSDKMGWQDYAIIKPENVMFVADQLSNPSYALGILGMPGFTGYMGLLDIGKPIPGETIVVAAATGPVGSTVGQIGKIKGCQVIGIAGGKEKCDYAVNTLGFDHCIDHYSPTFTDDLARVCPKGIDIYFENVGGKVFDAVFPLLNMSARIPVCGLIASYNATNLPVGQDRLSLLMGTILRKRLLVQGFIIFDDYPQYFPLFQKEMTQWINEGKMQYKEDIIQGLENATNAFIGLLNGKNFGKLVIQVGQE